MTINWEDIDWRLMREMAYNQNRRFKHNDWYEDVIHDAYIKVATTDKPSKLGWVTYYLNTVRYLLRSKAKLPKRTVSTDDEDTPEQYVTPSFRRVHPILRKFKKADRGILIRLLMGYEGKEIAELEGYTPQNLSLKRKKIQEQLRGMA